ncbi:uncharacterized protein [Rutidosis leptorrhynchoides]|uniref:uncharacterized protein isoform X2 n=1 Tax=Rutidosis leptorrhynchoides TaxID=125765 RepID=UPI003A9A4D63
MNNLFVIAVIFTMTSIHEGCSTSKVECWMRFDSLDHQFFHEDVGCSFNGFGSCWYLLQAVRICLCYIALHGWSMVIPPGSSTNGNPASSILYVQMRQAL